MKKALRERKNEEFKEIIAQKHSIASRACIIYRKKSNANNARIGISVSKKLGKAHVRNKIKRQLRMMLMASVDFAKEDNDYIIIVRQPYLKQSFADNKKDLENTIKKVKMR